MGLGVVLAIGAVSLLVNGALHFGHTLLSRGFGEGSSRVLEQLLLNPMIIEIQVSFGEHVLAPESSVLWPRSQRCGGSWSSPRSSAR